MTKADAPPEPAGAASGSEAVVPGYRIEGLLRRRSANDTVHAATQVADGRSVELRVVTARVDPDVRALFDTAVLQPASIVHPHLPAVYDGGDASQGLYMATARVDGATLAELAGQGGLPPLRAVRLLGSVGDALDAIHREGFAHGDVRPENVIVVERHVEHPYLIDFELARMEAGGGDSGKSAAGDLRAFAAALSACLAGEPPEELGRLLADAMSGTGPPGRYSAGERLNEGARPVFAAPGPTTKAPPPARPARYRPMRPARPPSRPAPAAGPAAPARRGPAPAPAPAPEPAPVPRAAPRSPAWPAEPGRRVPVGVALLVVAAAAVGGFLVGRPSGDEGDPASLASPAGVNILLPGGWESAPTRPRIPGLDLPGAVAAGPDGRAAMVAGRLSGLRGSVYPAAIARRVNPRPPPPAAVSLDRYQALRFSGIDAGRAGRVTLFVAPTAGGTLAAACLRGAPPACERAVGSLALGDSGPSSLAAGERYARRLDRVVTSLSRRRSVASLRLRSAALSQEQAGAATDLVRAYRDARRSLSRAAPPPAALAAQRRIVRSLARAAGSYRSLARAASRRRRTAFRRAGRSARRAERQLGSVLRGL